MRSSSHKGSLHRQVEAILQEVEARVVDDRGPGVLVGPLGERLAAAERLDAGPAELAGLQEQVDLAFQEMDEAMPF